MGEPAESKKFAKDLGRKKDGEKVPLFYQFHARISVREAKDKVGGLAPVKEAEGFANRIRRGSTTYRTLGGETLLTIGERRRSRARKMGKSTV